MSEAVCYAAARSQPMPHTREARALSVQRLEAMKPHVDRLVGLLLFPDDRDAGRAEIHGLSRARKLTRARKICWLLLRRHPDARVTFIPLAVAYNRDHTTVVAQLRRYTEQLEDGHFPEDRRVIQQVCDGLARKGFRPVKFEDLL